MNLDKVIELQNGLNPTLFHYIKNICTNGLNWTYLNNPTYLDNSNFAEQYTERENESSSFSSILYINGTRVNELTAFFESALTVILDKAELQLLNLQRIRVGMMLRSNQHQVNVPHIDDDSEHVTALLYLNTCNAPTILYDKFYDKNPITNSQEYLTNCIKDNLNVYKKISCVENSVVIFNGMRYHSSTVQTDTKRRIVITYNFTIS